MTELKRMKPAAICLGSVCVIVLVVVALVHVLRKPVTAGKAAVTNEVVRAGDQVMASVPTLANCDLGVTNLQFEEIAPGVAYARGQLASPPLVYHVVKADLARKGLRVGVLQPGITSSGAKQKITNMVNDAATDLESAVAAINGDYYAFGVAGPWGIHLQQKKLYYSPTGKSALLVDESGLPLIAIPTCSITVQLDADPQVYPVVDFNRPSGVEAVPGLHLFGYAKEFADVSSLAGAAVIEAVQPGVDGVVTGVVTKVVEAGQKVQLPANGLVLSCNGTGKDYPGGVLKVGARIAIRTVITPSASEAIGGGPRIVKGGKPSLEFDKETFSTSHAGYLHGRHPRSAVGISEDRKTVIMLVAVGRRASSPGMTVDELARLLVELGSWDAMMFDGGGSAVMYTRKHNLVNKSKGRSLCNALGIFVAR
ncbi:MAG: phosphodiester glycosidase family protein [bacterium]